MPSRIYSPFSANINQRRVEHSGRAKICARDSATDRENPRQTADAQKGMNNKKGPQHKNKPAFTGHTGQEREKAKRSLYSVPENIIIARV